MAYTPIARISLPVLPHTSTPHPPVHQQGLLGRRLGCGGVWQRPPPFHPFPSIKRTHSMPPFHPFSSRLSVLCRVACFLSPPTTPLCVAMVVCLCLSLGTHTAACIRFMHIDTS